MRETSSRDTYDRKGKEGAVVEVVDRDKNIFGTKGVAVEGRYTIRCRKSVAFIQKYKHVIVDIYFNLGYTIVWMIKRLSCVINAKPESGFPDDLIAENVPERSIGNRVESLLRKIQKDHVNTGKHIELRCGIITVITESRILSVSVNTTENGLENGMRAVGMNANGERNYVNWFWMLMEVYVHFVVRRFESILRLIILIINLSGILRDGVLVQQVFIGC